LHIPGSWKMSQDLVVFTIILPLIRELSENLEEIVDTVATASVKNFGDGEVEKYTQWSKNVSGTQWLAKSKG